MTSKKKFVDLTGAQGRAQYVETIKQILSDGVCPFCTKNFLRYHTRPILRRGKYWLVTENMNPYHGSKNHYLFVSTKHVESPDKLPPQGWGELQGHIRWLKNKYRLPAGSFFMRFGDTRYTGASVAHLHAQLLVGSRRSRGTEPISVVLGHKKKNPRA